MNKLNKLFAIIIAVLGVQTLSAQTNIIADWDGGSNTGKPTTFGWVSSYGSRSWGELNGGGARVTNTYSGYKKEDGSAYSYVADSEPSTQILWLRYNSTSETYTYTFQGLEAGKVYRFTGFVGWHNNSNAPTFTIKVNGDKELAKVTKYCGVKQTMYPFSVDFMVPVDNQSTNFTLTFNSNQSGDNMEALSALSIVENTDIANATEASPYDMTSWLQDPGFEEATGGAGSVNTPPGWKITYSLSGWLDGTPNTTNPSEGTKCYNLWAGTVNSIDMYQTLYLPAGKYRVSADLRTDGVDKITNQGVYANVGGIISKSGTIQTVASTWNSLEGWNTLSTTFNNGSAGEVTIGISSTGNGGNSGWFQVDNVRLEYLGYDLSEALNALNALVATAQGIIDANEVSPQSVLSLQTAIEAANSVQQTEEAIAEASTALTEAINAANATIAACNEYKSMLALSESMYTNSTADDKSTFEAAINKAKTDFNAATSIDAISAIVTDLQNAQKAYCLVAVPAEGHPFDMTFLIVNPDFNQDQTGWTSEGGAQNKAIASNKPEPITGKFYENWNPSNFTGTIYQVIQGLPNGTYRLKAAAFGNDAVLFANDATTQMANNDNTPAWYEVEVKVNDGTLRFGVRNESTTGWMGIDNVSLKFISGLDLSEFVESYEAVRAEAIAARDNAEYNGVTGIERTNLIQAINNTPEESKEGYQSATDALRAAISAFTAAKGDYDKLSAEIVVAEGLGMADDQITSVTSGKTGSVAYNDLKVAEYEFIMGSYSESVQLGNWTSTFDNISGQSYDGSDTKYYDKWGDGTFDLKQSVTLPAGDYAVSVIARGQSGASGTLYYKIGDATTSTSLIMKGDSGLGVDVNGVANFSAGGSYSNNNAGRGWEYRFITFHLDAETSVEIGVTASVSWQWASAYAPMLYTTEASQKVLLLDEINTLLSDVPSGKMGAAVAAALESAVSVAEGVSNATELSMLSEVASDLRSAVADANASISDYSKLKKYIDMTAVFTDVTEYQNKYDNGEYTADDVEPVRQELNVMRYNAASAVFTNKIEVTGWTGDLANGVRSDQHWSGETRSYYDANSWVSNFVGLKHTLSTTVTLPEGTYVLKAAGRSSADATLRLNIKNRDTVLETVEYTGKGDQGYGIDTSGAANFADEGTYANEGKGRGWEWEFVKFELNEETEVTLHVEVDYNSIQNRFGSFSDITLWMDDETYVTVNGGAINAPLAAAKALVDTKPMGVAEKTALQNAIAQAEGTISTPAELDGAIAALETAVANANAWVAAYNEAKAPLVASLERFEYGFNDGAEGRQIPLTDETWNALLAAVEEAALAKDETDSYSGFEGATTDFNTMMDWATNNDFSMANQLNCTSFIGNADCANNDAWIGSGRSVLSGEHWSGDASRNYFAQNFEPGAARTQVVSLPYSGWYYLRVSVRAVNAGSYCTIIVDGEEYTVNGAHGSVGGTIATDGTEWPSVAKGIAAGKTFANDNKGYGWVYKYIPFKIENATKDVTIQIALSNKDQNRPAYCGGMDLFYTGKNCHVKEGREVVHHGDYTSPFEAFHTTHNVTAAAMTAVSATPTNPNALIIANAGQVKDGTNNVVVNNACASLSLTDGKYDFDAINAFEATEVSYNRSFTADTWLTICLPFEVEIPENVKVETLSAVDLATKTFTFDEVTGTMAANTPYLIKNSSATAELFASVGAKSVAATTEIKSNVKATDETTDVDFCGTFTTVTSTELMENGKYDILFFGNDGQLYYLSDGVTTKEITFKPFRSYLRVAKDAINWSDGAAARVRHGGDATAIEDIIENEDGELVIYDLMGRRVSTMEKGRIYIVNGEKVLNK